MEETQVVVMIDRSAGNATVGDMWTETKVFPISTKIIDIYRWASDVFYGTPDHYADIKQTNLKLSIAQ